MKKSILIWLFSLFFPLVLFFVSCKQNSIAKKELWTEVINFFSPDTTYYPAIKKFPFPDSMQFAPLDSFFVNQHKLPIISDSNIIFFDNYRVNGQKLCCRQDTLEAFTDTIRQKKYLFAIGEYITVFQSNSYADTNLRTRKDPVSIPLWGIKLNTPYPAEKFKDEYEKLGAKFVKIRQELDEVYKQKWSDNDSISVETIQFKNSTDRLITSLSKDMSENEVDSIIRYVRSKFPNLKYREAILADSDGKPMKVIRIYFQGISISFKQVKETEYSFMITDYYETLKLILNNAETGYIFRDDLRVY